MTGGFVQLNILDMNGPGRRPSTPAKYRMEMTARTKAARERTNMTIPEIAQALSDAVGRTISPDTYRKWEKDNLIPHDLIVPFCYITGSDAYELLSGEPYRLGARILPFRRKGAA